MPLRSSRAFAVALVTFATFTDIVAYSVAVPVLPDLSLRLVDRRLAVRSRRHPPAVSVRRRAGGCRRDRLPLRRSPEHARGARDGAAFVAPAAARGRRLRDRGRRSLVDGVDARAGARAAP